MNLHTSSREYLVQKSVANRAASRTRTSCVRTLDEGTEVARRRPGRLRAGGREEESESWREEGRMSAPEGRIMGRGIQLRRRPQPVTKTQLTTTSFGLSAKPPLILPSPPDLSPDLSPDSDSQDRGSPTPQSYLSCHICRDIQTWQSPPPPVFRSHSLPGRRGLLGLRLAGLKLEGLLLEQRRLAAQLEHLRKPTRHWWELKCPHFHGEATRHREQQTANPALEPVRQAVCLRYSQTRVLATLAASITASSA